MTFFARGNNPARRWILQRVTGVALVFLGLWFVLSIPVLWHANPQEIGRWLDHPWRLYAMQATLVFLFWHLKLGVEVIIGDYLRGRWHLICQSGNVILCVGLMIAALVAVTGLVPR